MLVASPVRAEDSADEGDEEFVRSASDENTTEQQQSDSDSGLELQRRRISTRLNSSNSSVLTEGRSLRRLRRGRRGTVETAGAGEMSYDSPTGYASSPSATRRLRRGHADNVHSPLAGRQGGFGGGRSRFDGSSTEGMANGSAQRVVHQSPTQARRKVAPSLVAALADPGTESATTEPDMPVSPPPVIDKPREERSYKEFFPDLNVHMPLAVQFTGVEAGELEVQLNKLARGEEGLSTPVSSGGEAERPAASRTPSSLSIKLVFSDPESSAPSAPPPLRTGKSTQSYAGTPQSSVVVLAPKRPVVGLPATKFRRLDTGGGKGFVRPEGHYIRNVELTEKDLAERIEYDLDEVDREWLARLNAERAAQGHADVSAKLLENILDHIEKEWFDLVKDVQKAISAQQQEQLPAEESACAICGEEECDNTNAIVFCDGCNLAVHQDCYGVPYIPEGQWLCRPCMLSPDSDVACVLCPQRGGALKKTTTNKWAHVLCALWIPEVGIANTVYMEPIDSIDQIPRSRWRLSCHLCHRRAGACIQCSHRQCFTAFHATCARRARLAMSVKPDRRTGDPVFRAYCERHTPASHTQPVDLEAPLKLKLGPARRPLQLADSAQWPPPPDAVLEDPAARDLLRQAVADDDEDASLQLTARVFNAARPVLNEFVFARVAERVPHHRLGLLQRARLVGMVARFWALKRSVRHGAPLLKRLHLEPWTASVTQQRAHDMHEEQRQSVARRIRTDLERVRLLTESVRRREREKLRRVRLQVEYLRRVVDPLTPILLPVLDELIQKRDPRGVFVRPVAEAEAPDYFEIVKQPMDFGTMRERVAAGGYVSVDDFERDLLLVVANCMKYNQPNTYYFQLAARVKRHIERLVGAVRQEVGRLPIDPNTGCLQVAISPEIFTFNLDVPPIPAILDESSEQETAHKPDRELPPDQEPAEEPKSVDERDREPEPKPKPEPEPPQTPVVEPRVTRSRQQQKHSEKKQTQSEKHDKRRLTLFEQLSVPPPDVRKSMRDRFAQHHADGTMPDNDIPDDINVLGSRLRHNSPAKRKTPQTDGTAAKRARTTASGTVVWAKMESYPWFPAEVRSSDDPDVPENVSNGAGRRDEAALLVRFFGASTAQWRWVSPSQVCPLGEDAERDQNFFRARKARSSNMVKSIRAAYAEACTTKDIEPLATLD
ncbi:hypothetical protein IWW50_002048 [Coemansia erecta]|nr:hypothetical protein IWW50_002048 [Coemansia erecta]